MLRSEPSVSPYLLRPLRSLDEVLAERAREAQKVAQRKALGRAAEALRTSASRPVTMA